MLMFAAAADFGRAFYAYVAIQNAVKEGALYGANNPICDDDSAATCTNPNNVTWRVRNEANLANADGTPLAPTVACLDRSTGTAKALLNCVEGDTYRVSLNYQFRLLTPIASNIVGTNLNLGAEADAIVLNLAFDPTPGISVQKLVEAATADNGADVVAKCTVPEDIGAPGYYRSPCRDTSDNNNPLHLRYDVGDTVRYRVIVRNTGAQALSGVVISDSLGWPATSASCPARPTTMAVGAVYECTYIRTAPTPGGGAAEGDYVNEANADASNSDPALPSAVTVKVEVPPANFTVVKAVSPYKLGSDGDGSPAFGLTSSLGIAFNAQVPSPAVWYRIFVRNDGGQTATGFAVSDTGGALPTGTADCPTVPSTLAVGASYTCLYQVPYTTAGTRNTTASATATNVTADAGDSSAVVVDVTQCTGAANRVVPTLIGLTKAQAQTAWTNAQFTGALSSWSGQNSALTVAQNQQAFACIARTSTVTISRTNTP
jgi:hypothetical protein